MGKKNVNIMMTGALAGTSFSGIKRALQTGDFSVGLMSENALDKEKTADAAKNAGIDCILFREGAESEKYILRKVRDVVLAILCVSVEQITSLEDIKITLEKARAEGADFIIAYAELIGDRDDVAVAKLAEVGVDYIIGYGRKKPRNYSVVMTSAGKTVPVIYNIGGLSGRQGIGIVFQLSLAKDRAGIVDVVAEGYHPCIAEGKLLLIEDVYKTCSDKKEEISLEEALFSIKSAMGINGRCECYFNGEKNLETLLNGRHTAAQKSNEVQPILTVSQEQKRQLVKKNPYSYDETKGYYTRSENEAENEASLVCTGHIEYSRMLEEDAECFGSYEFRKSFRTIAKCFEGSDFVIGNLAAMASPMHLSSGQVSVKALNSGYCNCRVELLETLKQAGFTAIASSCIYNASVGIEGILDTERAIKKNHMIPCGLGYHKNPIVDINGIKVGFVSITVDCIGSKNILTGEASGRFLNIFDHAKTGKEIEEVKARGADFVISYIHCGMNRWLLPLKKRKTVAEAVAKMGADYVICTGAKDVSEYYRFDAGNDRIVPIATSLGCFLTGARNDDGYEGAMLKVTIRKDFDGIIHVDDNCIPIKVFNQYAGVQNVIIPVEDSGVITALGNQIKRKYNREIKIKQGFEKNFTIAEIYQLLGKKPSEKDLAHFGDKYNKQVSLFTTKEDTIRRDSVAILFGYDNYDMAEPIEWDIQKCVNAGVLLLIDNKYHEELPCIVVDEPLMDIYEKLANTVVNRYGPIKVAITGTMGKTTTKEMMMEVFNSHYKTLTNVGSFNTTYICGLMVQKLQEDDEAYVQEVSGGTLGMAAATSRLMEPDICILTNVEKNHISKVGTLEKLVENKLGIVDGLKPEGVFILCKDNENLKDIEPEVRTIKYSSHDETCHYYAKNIRTVGDYVTFDIIVNESEFDVAGVYPAKIYVLGEHNVRNAVAVFAASRQAGIPPYKIIAGLSRYRATGIRQNVVECNGATIIMDTFNSNPVALLSMCDVFDEYKPGPDGRKIMILGMMGEQGEDSPRIHYETGKAISKHDFDMLFCFGEDMKYMVEAVKECGKKAYYFSDRDVFNKVIAKTVKPGDVVMVKGSHSMQLDTETMAPIYGKALQE